MELEILDLTISCRLCLSACTDGSTSLDNSDLADQLSHVFSRPFHLNDWFPKIVCNSCVALVGDLSKFVRKVSENQEYLESLELPVCGEEDFVGESVETGLDEGGSSLEDRGNEPELATDRQNVVDQGQVAESFQKKSVSESGRMKSVEPNLVTEQDRSRPKRNKAKNESSKPKLVTNSQNTTNDDDLIKQYYKIQCDICLAESSNFTTLLLHFRDTHATSGYIKCCNKKLYRRCRLLEHISKHLNPETFRCSICNRNYACKASLELHNMHQHLSEDQKPFKCPKCPKSFAKDYQLTSHAVRHVAVECPECGKIMSSRMSLKDHLLKMHREPTQGLLVCDTCGQQFRTKPAFERHMQQHLGLPDDNRAQCDICEKWFANKLGLKQHVRTQHVESGENFVCGICGKIAPNSAALRQHRSVTHGEQKYKCELCGKSFKRAISLREHRATHTGEPLYSCKLCPITFSSNANMYKHLKRIHPNAWKKNKRIRMQQQGN